jgi:hypothetical protein
MSDYATYLHDLRRPENFTAHWAFLTLPPLVNSQVLIQIGFLGETLVTSRLLALEGALSCMDSEMVEEIVPLSEEHVAATVVTL